MSKYAVSRPPEVLNQRWNSRHDRDVLIPGKPADSDIVEKVRSSLEMLSEYPETEGLFLGAERLGRLCGRSGRWIRQREAERVIERASLNGQTPRKPLYDIDEALPRLVGFLTAKRQPSPEQLELIRERLAAGSRDGTYVPSSGSSHKGSRYANPNTGNHYRDRAHGVPY